MQIGIGLPAAIPGVDGELILEWARRADESAFSSLGLIDRVVYPNYEPLVTLAAAAGVTVDDTHTMRFSFTYGRIDEKRHEEGSFGQEAERPYEERQRLPGDYDAQVSQRPIAIHDLEHRDTTDRGVIMVRNMIRRGVHAVRRGEDPQGVSRNEGEVVLPTHTTACC